MGLFSRDKLLMRHDDPYIFLQSQWQKADGVGVFYFVYRWFVTGYFLLTWVSSIIDPNNPDPCDFICKLKWAIYITDWGYTCILMQSLMCAIGVTCWMTSVKEMNAQEDDAFCLCGYYKVYWILNIIATDLAFGITAIYWSLIYDENVMVIDFVNVSIHAMNSIMMMVDLWTVAHPIYLVQVYLPVAFMMVYATFTYVYFVCGGTSHRGDEYIYVILNWKHPRTCLLVVLGVVALTVGIHSIVCGIQHLRSLLAKHLKGGGLDESRYDM